MREIIVDQIMRKPVFFVQMDDIVEVAINKMKEYGTKKILVKDGNKPIGVLEKWKILSSDHSKMVKHMDLSHYRGVPLGTALSAVQSDLSNYPAIYIFEPDDPNNILGVITAYDLSMAY
jgi:predicted transcriptional regulator